MVTNEFAEASAELIEILNYVPKSEVEKIPLELRSFFEKAAKPGYSVQIDPYKSLNQQVLKEKTKDLITVIYRNYWCTEEERKLLDERLIENDRVYEEKLQMKFDPKLVFENKVKQRINDVKASQELIEKKSQSFIQNIFAKIRCLFKWKRNS